MVSDKKSKTVTIFLFIKKEINAFIEQRLLYICGQVGYIVKVFYVVLFVLFWVVAGLGNKIFNN